jgi:NitT/TauT family transport system ATP-binding protein
MPVAVKVMNVAKYFMAGRARVCAVKDVSLDVSEGEFVVLLGPSGCGKSTLLRIVSGLTEASAGAVAIFGTPVSRPDPRIGMVFQSYTSFPWLTVEQNVAFGLTLAAEPRSVQREIAMSILERFGLSKFASSYPFQLSGGMQQRVAIARMLAVNPKVLLMDEPFGALDALTRVDMQSFLINLWQQDRKTVLFVTHDIDEAILLADRVVVMSPHPGRIADVVPVSILRPRSVNMTEDEAFIHLRHRLRTMIFGMRVYDE